MESFQESLTDLWKTSETKQLANIFKRYMEDMGIKKWDRRRIDNQNTYLIDGNSTGWNRAQCYFYKDCTKYAENDLGIILRKRSGSYLIVERKGERAFEVDYSGLVHYDEKLLKEIIKDHKPLFDALLKLSA